MVCGALLNFRADLEALGERMNGPPYLAPPRAPVLYLKPRNTWRGAGDDIPLPSSAAEVLVGATLGLVIGRSASRVSENEAARHVRALCVVNDVSLAHADVFRPAIKERCRDGFCPLGPSVAVTAADLATFRPLRTFVNGRLAAEWNTTQCVRSPAQLLADVSAFMTLSAGDILLVGTPRTMPSARLADRVTVEIEGIGQLENRVVAERAS
jgi:5-oxopent-3-ene-1,2,5-tricarboxylate decarboxylase/2-hydroxyhepta-2,4-diene-1,7-dioate isomerase